MWNEDTEQKCLKTDVFNGKNKVKLEDFYARIVDVEYNLADQGYTAKNIEDAWKETDKELGVVSLSAFTKKVESYGMKN